MALVTNFVLLCLTAGRIWRKGRQASVVLGAGSGRRHNTALAIICESSLLYVLAVFIYLLSVVTQDAFAILQNITWGALAQVVNIVPMMIMVRVGMSRAFDAQGPGRGVYVGRLERGTGEMGRDGSAMVPLTARADSSMVKSGARYPWSD
ncbi:hypothetical protein GGX14DRAFT_700562 [Mycena pura]|uniref:Uncharacterized protein n=1 Tax=Mycena pura TaxID=153505 RepID=A0AAD6V3B7_9AGAR|nr:hypothetical protein GGX14DRAFT_700562 [Mycena pura]